MSERRAAYRVTPNKYHNEPCYSELCGRGFASKAEMRRGEELALLERAGAITDLVYQPRYELEPGWRNIEHRWVRPIVYVADFGYTEHGRKVAEEVKGFEGAVWLLKKKLFQRRYPDIGLRIIR